MIRNFLSNVSNYLKPGAAFIATLCDCDAIVRCFRCLAHREGDEWVWRVSHHSIVTHRTKSAASRLIAKTTRRSIISTIIPMEFGIVSHSPSRWMMFPNISPHFLASKRSVRNMGWLWRGK